jgi:hypothetical protein
MEIDFSPLIKRKMQKPLDGLRHDYNALHYLLWRGLELEWEHYIFGEQHESWCAPQLSSNLLSLRSGTRLLLNLRLGRKQT